MLREYKDEIERLKAALEAASKGNANPFQMAAMRAAPAADGAVWVKGWAGPCYGQVDWFALMPRHLASSYFSVEPGASCAWAAATGEAVRQREMHVRRACPKLNERALVEWIAKERGGAVRNVHDAAQVASACALRERCQRGAVPWCTPYALAGAARARTTRAD